MKKIIKPKTGTTSTVDFYDQLSDKQKAKFSKEKDSFTIEFSEIESIYNFLDDKQTRTLILALGMFASTGKMREIADVLADLSNDQMTLALFNSMALRIKNHTKSWLNGRGQKKSKDEPEEDSQEEFQGKDWDFCKQMADAAGIDDEAYEMDFKYAVKEQVDLTGKKPVEVLPEVIPAWKISFYG